MRQKLTLLLLLFVLSIEAQYTIEISVENPLKSFRKDVPVVVNIKPYGHISRSQVWLDGREIPSQLDDLDIDEEMDELCFLVDLAPKQKQTYKVELYPEGEQSPYPARVYAEMLMRNDKVKEKNKHNNYVASLSVRGDCVNSYNLLHHHGVCFESELNGIRIYFDKRQTLDLYGKFSKRLELKDTQFYTSKEQKEQGYGDDVLWVGNTFGLGAMRGWDGVESTMIEPVKTRTQRVISYGPLRTIVEIIDQGWKPSANLPAVNMTIRYTQYAGHRDTDVDVMFNRTVNDYQFSTGIINVKGSMEYSDHKGLRACWGTDYPSTDTIKWKPETVGLAILIPQQHIVSEDKANKDNYPFVVKAYCRQLSYKVAYTSANESFGFADKNAWFEWLREWRRDVENPVRIKVNH